MYVYACVDYLRVRYLSYFEPKRVIQLLQLNSNLHREEGPNLLEREERNDLPVSNERLIRRNYNCPVCGLPCKSMLDALCFVTASPTSCLKNF